ncbi:tetraspanin-5-like [Onthophagus taurus]|uniref:tetraspanin-5-like n=1 Tax=Onthophagus taurus TaxID=166361 RepID=UPI0039BE53DF
MKLQINENVVKFALLGFNFIFSILSVALIALGIVYGDELGLLKRYVGLEFLELPTLLIVLGCLSFAASLLGCYCARNNNQKLLKFFIVFIALLLALELTISLISFFNMDESLESNARNIMKVQLLSHVPSDKNEFHQVESYWKCCGIDSGQDYIAINTSAGCCDEIPYQCSLEVPSNVTNLIKPGCLEIVVENIYQIALEIGCYSASFCILQFSEIICVLLRTISP